MKPIPPEDLPRMIGKGIHLAWANRGCVWILDAIEGDKIHLHTPKTKKVFMANAKDALYTRKNEPGRRT